MNEHPGLTVLHIAFARLHNRLANLLRYMRPLYSDDEVFMRARAIVGAIVQKIMYADWLPIILGEATMRSRGLSVGPRYGRPEYSSMIDPSVPSSFGAAVFRSVMVCARGTQSCEREGRREGAREGGSEGARG